MTEYFEKFVQSKCPGAKPLFVAIRGSQAYGTALPTSDTDYSGVFIQDLDSIIGNQYVEQISDEKNDIVFYEVRRFLELLSSNNPTVLELLNTPEDCIVYKHPLYDKILQRREDFITKQCAKSFGGYGVQQIKKAKGQDKKQNWEKDRVTRKDVLDFCYVIEGEKSIPWKHWRKTNHFEEKFIGAVSIPNARELYALFFDEAAYLCFSESIDPSIREKHKETFKSEGFSLGFGYKGLVKIEEGESNQLRLSSIPKGQTPFAFITFNKDGYGKHCKDFHSYQEWLEKRNEQRWVDVQTHEQKIDGKNMMHCRRLLEMSREIAEGKGINVRRPNAKDLIAIRKGEVDLQSLIDLAETDIKEIEDLFQNSTLPDLVDPEMVTQLLVQIRKSFYQI